MQQLGRPSQSIFHRLQILGAGSAGTAAGQDRSPRFAGTARGGSGGGGGGWRARPLRLVFLAGATSRRVYQRNWVAAPLQCRPCFGLKSDAASLCRHRQGSP